MAYLVCLFVRSLSSFVDSFVSLYRSILDAHCLRCFSLFQSVKRPKSLGNVTEHLGPESPSSEWSEVSFPPSGDWSPPVFIRTKDPREEQRKQYEKDCR